MPVLGRLYLAGVTGVAPAFAWIYRGPMTLVMLVGLLLLVLGMLDLVRAGWRSGRLPDWAGVALTGGLAAWLPLLPPAGRVVDGLVIGLGGVGLAWGIWQQATSGAEAGVSGQPPAGIVEAQGYRAL
jgi:hypothetical protein